MTTLYRPVLIESAEQAEALPVDTIAFLRGTFYDVPTVDLAAVKSAGDSWDYTTDDEQMTDVQMVGWTALVPTEAEEIPETFRDRRGPGLNDHRTVYRTPWEEA